MTNICALSHFKFKFMVHFKLNFLSADFVCHSRFSFIIYSRFYANKISGIVWAIAMGNSIGQFWSNCRFYWSERICCHYCRAEDFVTETKMLCLLLFLLSGNYISGRWPGPDPHWHQMHCKFNQNVHSTIAPSIKILLNTLFRCYVLEEPDVGRRIKHPP